MKIAVIGTGYVGLVTGACFAETGNDVTCVDIDRAKVDRLSAGDVPFYEPGLSELVVRNVSEGRLRFTSDTSQAIGRAALAFICVGTPSNEDGSADLQHVLAVADSIAKVANHPLLLVIKSTVPVGTYDRVKKVLDNHGRKNVRLVSNPEFLREGTAVQDCLMPDRVVIGTEDPEVAELMNELYHPFVRTGHPIFVLDPRSAEMTKYAANALLAMRISFMNEISMLCDKLGADVTRVRAAIGADQRIGTQYLFPSVGFGGSCFPKDVRALATLAEENGLEPGLFRATLNVNEAQKQMFIRKVLEHFGGLKGIQGKRLAVWGLAFKAKTDDIRESPAITVIDGLLAAGARLTLFDPVAVSNAKAVYKERAEYAKTSMEAVKGADALCVLTEWNQFRHPDFGEIKQALTSPVIFDGRNLYDPDALQRMGFTYYSVGRKTVRSARQN